MSKRRTPPKTADTCLPLSLTNELIEDLNALITEGVGEFDYDYLGRTFLSKFVDPTVKEGARERKSKAIEKWLLTELTNEVTNRRLRDTLEDGTRIIFEEITVERFFQKLAEVVGRIAGNTPKLDLAQGGFSGGATTSKSRRDGHPAIKFRDQAHATPEAWALFFDLIDEGSPWANHMASKWEYITVEGNVMFTVPKSSDIDRVACKEPDLNVFIQKGLGDQLRKKLRSVGINLNDQSVNGELARVGSVSRELATLDLSSASDSVTCSLVERVMPSGWVSALSAVRSKRTRIGDDWHVNHMFSSMGNGFTFELESLLFFGICRTVQYFTGVKGIVSVYGDDLIVPVGIVDNLIEALQYCGFSVNSEKSFWDEQEPFRESCGCHWYNGRDVTPFYVRGPLRTVTDLILVLNQLSRWGSKVGGVLDPRVEEVHTKWMSHVPKDYWGGQDLDSRYALVTGDRPRFKLRPVNEDKPHHHIGGYLAWLHKTADRIGVLPVRNLQSLDEEIAGLNQHRILMQYVSWLHGTTLSEAYRLTKATATISEAVVTTGFFRRRRNMEEVNHEIPYFVR